MATLVHPPETSVLLGVVPQPQVKSLNWSFDAEIFTWLESPVVEGPKPPWTGQGSGRFALKRPRQA